MINMESAPSNLHHHHHHHQLQLQQQLLVIGSSSSSSSSSSSTSSLVTPSWYEAATNHTWSTPLNTNSGNYNHNNNNNINEDDHHIIVCNNSTTTRNNNNSSRHEMIQDLGSSFHWPSSNNNAVGSIYFPNKFTEMMLNSSSSCSSIEDLNANNNNNNGDLLTHEKLLLNTTASASASASSGFVHNNCSSGFGGRGTFSQIFPSINISDLTRQPSSTSSAISSSCFQDMNLQALDLLTSARFSNQQQSSLHDPNFGALFKESVSFNPHQQQHQMQQVLHRPPCGNPTYKISSPPFINGVAQQTAAKRPSSTIMEPKQSTSPAVAAAPKKLRLESRTCPPFKVRKEKLGDRIAALQQLVAPFGKTDTASVLMEAIGYIKFLQNQVETLSVPYMKSSRNNNNNTHRTTHSGQIEDDGNEETKRDLRSRGLCLVPLSCMSYVTSDGGGGVGIGVGGIWPPSDYLGGN